jgi:hypothetical protein
MFLYINNKFFYKKRKKYFLFSILRKSTIGEQKKEVQPKKEKRTENSKAF